MFIDDISEKSNYRNKNRELNEINEIIEETRKEDDKFMIAAKRILKRYHKAFEELAK